MRIPDRPIAGQPLSAKWGSDIVDNLVSLRSISTPDILSQIGPNGTTHLLAPHLKQQIARASSANANFPWRVYQHAQATPDANDWRNVRVYRGALNSQYAVKSGTGTYSDDLDATEANRDILIPASTTNGILYIEANIVTTAGATQGNVSSLYFKFSATGWSDYPNQPTTDWELGLPPAKFYATVATITTGATEGLTINQNMRYNATLSMFGWELITSESGILLAKRMALELAP